MKRAGRRQTAGYTIVETMIFLVVTAAMFVSMTAFISGRQNRTEFNSGIRDFESSINDLANDVSNGYYANATTSNGGASGRLIKCSASGTGIRLDYSTTDEQGKNQGCIFIGKALQFNSSNFGADKFVALSLVGKQYKGGNASLGDVTSYEESSVKAIAQTPDDTSIPDAYSSNLISTGLTVTCVLYATTSFATPPEQPCSKQTQIGNLVRTDVVAFMTKFNAMSLDSETRSGSASVNLVVPTAMDTPVNNSIAQTPARSVKEAARQLNAFTDKAGASTIVVNPPGGVYICLQSGGTNQYALLSMGGQSSRFSTAMTVRGGTC